MSKNGLILLTPTSIAYTGTSATISANGSVSFSAISQLRLNGVFSADYDNYMLVSWNLGTSAGGPPIYARLSAAGVDATTNYTWQFLYGRGTSLTGQRLSTEGYMRFGMTDSTNRSGEVVWIYGPYLAQPTAARNVCIAGFENATLIDYANTHSTSLPYDGLNIIPGSGSTLSGRVAVYGMRK